MSEKARESTPLSSSSFDDPLASPLGGFGSNRATTTERRTTTTTTTKRIVKSSDDFLPSEIQQTRSESRSGSISSERPTSTHQDAANLNSNTQQRSSSNNYSSTSTTTTQSGTEKWNAESFHSPVVEDTENGKVLKIRFDVNQYKPDEIVVKTVENRLQIHAKHEEKSENKTVYREYNREFHLPDGTDVEQIRSVLSKEGILTVECPLPKAQLAAASRRIPIEKC